jgi:deazaflavin-dependent oxidoreductase (nitroreductase family)
MSEDQEKILFGDEHVQRYQETDGEVGHDWRGTSTLLLTTTGRKTGEQRTTPLIYQPVGGDAYAIVASKGGADQPPAWYLNLQAEPTVGVQVKGDRFTARARTATPDEKPDLWRTMTATWPAYDDYQSNTEREIPVVVLERAE